MNVDTPSLESSAKVLKRWAAWVEYDGSAFHGWQRQENPQLPSIQFFVEQALSLVADHPVAVLCAGRTDTGVHASAMVIHFNSHAVRSESAWVRGANTHLPASIVIKAAVPVSNVFHARFSALSRTYRYLIMPNTRSNAHLNKRVTFFADSLSVGLMQQGADYLLGEHDFSAFRGSRCQSRSTHRCVHSVKVFVRGPFVIIEICANAFLLRMVRNIVGVLMEVGAKREKPSWVYEVLKSCDRKQAAKTAPADGLYFVKATYPDSLLPSEQLLGPSFVY